MSAYKKRLLIFFVVMLLSVTLMACFVLPLLHADVGDINAAALSQLTKMNGYGRIRSGELVSGDMEYTPKNDIPQDFKLVLQNGHSELYFNEKTAEIAVKIKKSGQVWFSNPYDRADESFAAGRTKDKLSAQLSVKYFDTKGKTAEMDSYSDSVKIEGMNFSNTDDKLSVTYKMGTKKLTVNDIPRQMAKEKFEAILKKLSSDDASDLKRMYGLATLKGITDNSKRGDLIKKYKNIEKNDVYYFRNETSASTLMIETVMDYLKEAGYTAEDLIKDNEENMIEDKENIQPWFNVTVAYSLDGEHLKASLDLAKLEHDPSMPPYEISLLEAFGTANKDDKGYMFVPDGSGTLIYLNNGKNGYDPIALPIYGTDTALISKTRYQSSERAALPVFGIKKGNSAFCAVIEKGDGLAVINSRVNGMSSSYNMVYSSFNLRASSELSLTDWDDSSAIHLFEENPYNSELSLRYMFLSDDKANYSGMANACRELFVKNGQLVKKEISNELPYHLSVLGAVTKKELVLGIPAERLKAMTTYSQAGDIAKNIKNQGVSSLNLRYIGWFNNGLKQQTVKKAAPLASLGGQRELSALNDSLKTLDVGFYPEISFLNIYKQGNGFNVSKDSVRRLNRDIATGYFYDRMNRYWDYKNVINLLSPSKLSEYIEGFKKSFKKTGLNQFASADLGSTSGSDFNRKKTVDRQESIDISVEALKSLSENKIMGEYPNLYALAYINTITDMPLCDSGYSMADQSVPFYPMVVRGYLDYAPPPINFAADYHTALLQAVEYGAGLSFLLMHEDPALLKETDYNYFYTGNKKDWEALSIKDYSRLNSDLKALQGLKMISHSQKAFNVYKTEYEGGKCVYVNYTQNEVSIDGISVGAMDYTVKA